MPNDILISPSLQTLSPKDSFILPSRNGYYNIVEPLSSAFDPVCLKILLCNIGVATPTR